MSLLEALKAKQKKAAGNVQQEQPANEKCNTFMWGHGGYYRLAQGDENHRGTPVQVKATKSLQFVDVCNGAAHILGLTEQGEVYSWGKCHVGQLGHGKADEDEKHPKKIEALAGTKIKVIGCGISHILLVSDQGEVWTNGVSYYGCLGHGDEKSYSVPKKVDLFASQKVSVALGGFLHSVFLLVDGSVYTSGKNEEGQLGLGKQTSTAKLPTKVPDLPPIQSIFVGHYSNFAISKDNNVLYGWGQNNLGELGIGNSDIQYTAVKINTDKLPSKIIKIVNDCATFALLEDGSLYGWGSTIHLGLGTNSEVDANHVTHTPTLIPFSQDHPIQDVSAGHKHAIVLTRSGEVFTWGEATYGKLGNFVTSDSNPFLVPLKADQMVMEKFCYYPQKVELSDSIGKIKKVCAGSNHCIVLV